MILEAMRVFCRIGRVAACVPTRTLALLVAFGIAGEVCSQDTVPDTPISPSNHTQALEAAAIGRLAELIHRSLPEKWRAMTDVPTLTSALRDLREQIEGAIKGRERSAEWDEVWDRLLQAAFPNDAATVRKDIDEWLRILERSLGIEDGHLFVSPPDEARLIVFFDQKPLPPPETFFRAPTPRSKQIRTVLSGGKFRLDLSLEGVAGEGTLRLFDPLARVTFGGLRYDSTDRILTAGPSEARVSDFAMKFAGVTEKDGRGTIDQPQMAVWLGFLRLGDVKAERVEYRPDAVQAYEARLRFLGVPIIKRRSWSIAAERSSEPGEPARFRFDRVARVLQFAKPPSISLQGSSPKVSYNNTYTEGNAWSANLAFDAGRGFPLASTLQLTWNLSRDPETSLGVLSEAFLRNEIGGMFTANPGIRTLPDRAAQLRTRKFNLHAGTSNNTLYPVHRPGRPDLQDSISFPLYAGLEIGGPIGPFGGSVQFRFNQVDSRRYGKEGRWGAIGSFGIARGRLVRGLFYDAVVDGSIFNPGPDRFAWVRPSAELHMRAFPWLRLSGGFSHWKSGGAPPTPFDVIQNGNQFHARIDLITGPTQLSYANSYRVRDRSWYRSRLFLSQVIGAWKLEVTTDERFSGFGLALGLRLDSLLDGVQRRKPTGVRLEVGSPTP